MQKSQESSTAKKDKIQIVVDEGYGSMPLAEKELQNGIHILTTVESFRHSDVAESTNAGEELQREVKWGHLGPVSGDWKEADIEGEGKTTPPSQDLAKWKEATIDSNMEMRADTRSNGSSNGSSLTTGPLKKWKPVAMDLNLLDQDSSDQEMDTDEFDTDMDSNADIVSSSTNVNTSATSGVSHPQPQHSKEAIDKNEPQKKSWFAGGEQILRILKEKGKQVLEHHPGARPKSQPNYKSPMAPKNPLLLKRFMKKSASNGQTNVSITAKIVPTEKECFEKDYKIIRHIGTGGHSTVKLSNQVLTNINVVCKFIQSSNVWHWTSSKIPLEIEMMKLLKHENIITFHRFYDMGEGDFVIVMEWLGKEWMDLYDYVEFHGPVVEHHAKEIFVQVLDVIEFMHQHGYSHNDIKVTRKIKLIDFGSTMPLGKELVTAFYGTQKFAAPEALTKRPYRLDKQEVWAMGTLLYVLLFKLDPFSNDEEILAVDIESRMRKFRKGTPGCSPINISDDACDLILALLDKDADRRPFVSEIRSFAFFE